MDPFQNLSNEVILLQAINLPLETITQTCLVSQRFNKLICDNEYFWQQKFHADYGFDVKEPESWKKLYEDFSLIRGHPERFREYEFNDPQQVRNYLLPDGAPVALQLDFIRSALFTDDLIQFFANANLGPLIVDGQPTNRPLNDILLFTKRYIAGLPNPLYGISPTASLTLLFALHAYYSNMVHPDNKTRLSASQGMRDKLGQLMITAGINPDNFRYAEFSKLILQAKIRSITDEELTNLTSQVNKVYRNLFPDYNGEITANMIMNYQRTYIQHARDYKNKQRDIAARAVREARRALQQ